MKNSGLLLSFITVCLLLAFPVAGQAGEPAAILKGYGKTTWGESLAEVQKLFPAGKLGPGKPQRDLLDPAERALFASDQTPFYQDLTVPGSGPVRSTIYHFGQDQLFKVVIVWSSEVQNSLRQKDFDAVIDAKYAGLPIDRGRPWLDRAKLPVAILAYGSVATFEQTELAAKISADFDRHLDELGQKKLSELKLEDAL